MSKKDAVRAAVGASNKNIVNDHADPKDDKSPAIQPLGAVGPVQTPPSGGISKRIDKGERTLEFFRRGDCGRTIGKLGQQLISDLKRLLADTRAIVELVNDDDVIRDLLHHSYDLLRATATGKGYGPRMPVPAMVENWRMIVASLFTSADVLDMFSAGGLLVHTLHETDEFLVRLSEVVGLMMELLLSVPSQQEGTSTSEEEHKWAGLRAKTMEDLRVTWVALSKNRVWRSLHKRRRTNEPQDGRNLFAMWFDFLQHELTQAWIDDVCELLQRVVGDQANVDDALEATFAFLESIGQNTQLLVLIYDLSDTFARLTYDLSRMGPPQIESELLHFAVTLQKVVDEIKTDPMFGRARQECLKLISAVRTEPTTSRLMKDSKKAWKHLRSKNTNEYIDPKVLESLRHMVLPVVLEHLNTMRFPQIKSSSDFMGMVEYTLDNLHVDITSIMPSNIHIRFACTMEHGATRYQAQRTLIYIEVRNIHVHLHEVKWRYARHAFPRFTDAGTVDMNSAGEGMILRMKLELKEGLTHKRVLEPLAVRCYMDSIKLKFSGSKHNKLYNILTGLFSTRVKREIQKNFEQKVLQTTSDFNEAVAALVAHVKARPTSPLLPRRLSVSRRASISRRPSVSASSSHNSLPFPPGFQGLSSSHSSLPPAFRTNSIATAQPYEPPPRNLDLTSILKLPLPTRRGTPTPPTPPLRSTYPFNCVPSPPLCTSPVNVVAPEPSQRQRPASLPAALVLPPAFSLPTQTQKVRFHEDACHFYGYDSPNISTDDAKCVYTHKSESKPLTSILKKNVQPMYTSPIVPEFPNHTPSITKDLPMHTSPNSAFSPFTSPMAQTPTTLPHLPELPTFASLIPHEPTHTSLLPQGPTHASLIPHEPPHTSLLSQAQELPISQVQEPCISKAQEIAIPQRPISQLPLE